MAKKLEFDAELQTLHAKVLAYGQDVPAPAEDPSNFPWSLADYIITTENLGKVKL